MAEIQTTEKSVNHENTITVCADEWFPYNGRPGSGRPGILIEIINDVFSRRGYSVVYIEAPWARAVEYTRKGRYDAIVGAYRGDAPDFIFPGVHQALCHDVFFVLSENSWRYTGTASLKGVSVGVIKDYSYGDIMDDYIAENSSNPDKIQMVYGENPLELNIRKLIARRIGAFVAGRYVYRAYISGRAEEPQIKEAGLLSVNKVYVVFSPARPEQSKKYASILTEGTEYLRRSGRLKQIMNRYGAVYEDY